SDNEKEEERCESPTLNRLECKICYNRYDTRSRKPKLLGCLHRVCAKCLKKMVDMGESSPSIITCPFCRHETHVPDEEVSRRLTFDPVVFNDGSDACPLSYCWSPPPVFIVTTATHRSSDCLVITIMELTEDSPSSDSLNTLNVLYRPQSPALDSLPCDPPTHKCHSWTSRSCPRCLLGVYFSSLPLGIYLLMIGQLWMGVVLVSLVPCTLLLLVLYGFCQCLCTELMEVLATCTCLVS
uniref:E3 ubiquitin-protein ligase RNF182 n=1 Tax=Cynoglossus semilaevis TaxID=244447 RepID=A0A3P8X211_CYNSE